MQGIPSFTTAEITTGDAIRAILYVVAVTSIVLGIIAWSLAPIVRDIRQRRAARVRIDRTRHGIDHRAGDRG